MAFSVAPLLKRQSPSHAYGHGWIVAEMSKRWHPAISQAELLAVLTEKRKKSWVTKLRVLLFNTSGGQSMGGKIYFDASRVVPVAAEHRPRNMAFNYIVRAA